MGNILGETVQKFLGDKVKTRYLVEASDLFDLVHQMGILDDDDEMVKVFEYLDERHIDINFKEGDDGHMTKYKTMKSRFDLLKKLKINKTHIANIMEREKKFGYELVNSDFLKNYRSDVEEEIKKEQI